MVDVPITVACGNYDRTQAIKDGVVKLEGCAVTYLPLYPEEIFFRAFRYQEFDVSELSFSSYLRTVASGTSAYMAVPAFVSRIFRHSGIYIRTDRGIRTPQDLRGRLIGLPEYQITAVVWQPNTLQWRLIFTLAVVAVILWPGQGQPGEPDLQQAVGQLPRLHDLGLERPPLFDVGEAGEAQQRVAVVLEQPLAAAVVGEAGHAGGSGSRLGLTVRNKYCQRPAATQARPALIRTRLPRTMAHVVYPAPVPEPTRCLDRSSPLPSR